MRGITISKSSNRWKVRRDIQASPGADDCLYDLIDGEASVVGLKNEHIQPPIRKGCIFEMEWLNLKGQKILPLVGKDSAKALGLLKLNNKEVSIDIKGSRKTNNADILALSKPGTTFRGTLSSNRASKMAGVGESGGRRQSAAVAGTRRGSRVRQMSRVRQLSKKDVLFHSQRRESVSGSIADMKRRSSSMLGLKRIGADPRQNRQMSMSISNADEDVHTKDNDLGSERKMTSLMFNLSTIEDPKNMEKSARPGWKVLFDRKGKKKKPKQSMFRSAGVLDTSRVGIFQILDTNEAFANFKMLEMHSQTQQIFAGASDYMVDSLPDFIEWKKAVFGLRNVDFTNMTAEMLISLGETVVPPVFDYDEELDADDAENLGLWARGKQLSVLQTMIFVAAVVPQCLSDLIRLHSQLIVEFQDRGGHAIIYDDESWEETQKWMQRRHAKNKQKKAKRASGSNLDEVDNEDEEEAEGFDDDDNDDDDDGELDWEDVRQESLSTTNCWHSLFIYIGKSVESGEDLSPLKRSRDFFDGTQSLRLRDYGVGLAGC